MAYAVDYNLVVANPVENQVRKGIDREAARPALASNTAHLGMLAQQIDEVLYLPPYTMSSLRRSLANVKQYLIKFSRSATRITDPHRPYFAQIARTSSSGANSLRSACCIDSSSEASSSGVN